MVSSRWANWAANVAWAARAAIWGASWALLATAAFWGAAMYAKLQIDRTDCHISRTFRIFGQGSPPGKLTYYPLIGCGHWFPEVFLLDVGVALTISQVGTQAAQFRTKVDDRLGVDLGDARF